MVSKDLKRAQDDAVKAVREHESDESNSALSEAVLENKEATIRL